MNRLQFAQGLFNIGLKGDSELQLFARETQKVHLPTLASLCPHEYVQSLPNTNTTR